MGFLRVSTRGWHWNKSQIPLLVAERYVSFSGPLSLPLPWKSLKSLNYGYWRATFTCIQGIHNEWLWQVGGVLKLSEANNTAEATSQIYMGVSESRDWSGPHAIYEATWLWTMGFRVYFMQRKGNFPGFSVISTRMDGLQQPPKGWTPVNSCEKNTLQ